MVGGGLALAALLVASPTAVTAAAMATVSTRSPAASVRMWVPVRGGYLARWQDAATLARRNHPEVVIEVEPIWSEYWVRLTMALAEGKAPPLFAVTPDLAARLASKGMLKDLSEVAEAFPAPDPATAPFRWQGRVVAIPGFFDPVVLFANTDLLGQAGVAAPPYTSWAELLDAARRARNVARWGMGVNGWPPLSMFAWQAGAVVPDPKGPSPWDRLEPVAEAARFYRRFVEEELSPPLPASWQSPPDHLYRTGQAALAMGLSSDPLEVPGSRSPFDPATVREWAPAFAATVSPVPPGPAGGVVWAWVEGIAAPSGASSQALAALLYLAEAVAQRGWMAPTAERAAARDAALAAFPLARTPPALPNYLEWDAAWMQEVVVPLLRTHRRDAADPAPARAAPVEEILRAAHPALLRVLRDPVP